jgi:hypothetical protein
MAYYRNSELSRQRLLVGMCLLRPILRLGIRIRLLLGAASAVILPIHVGYRITDSS